MSYKLYCLPLFTILKHWRIKPLQLFLMLIGLTTATALWNSVHLINREAQKAYSDARAISHLSSEKILVSKTGSDFNEKYFGELRKNGWLITPRLEGEIKHSSTGKGDIIKVIGIDPLSASEKANTATLPVEFTPNEFLRGIRVILAGPKTVQKIKSHTEFQNVKVSHNMPEGYALMDISIAQKILKKKNKLSSLHIVGPILDNLSDIETRELKIHLNENNIDLDSLTKSFHLNLTAFGFLSYLVALFIVYSTINLAFEQRKGILKGLRTLGLSSITIAILMLIEILMISLTSGVLGVVLSYILATTLLPDVTMTLNGLFGANLKNNLSVDGSFWSSSLGISAFGAVCASGPTLWKSLALNPIDSAKKIAWFEKTKAYLKYQFMLITVIVSLMVYLVLFGSGLISAFLLLSAALVSATLMLPIFLWFALSLALKCKFKSPLIQWFFADCKQQINSLSVSLMALLLSLAVNIGVGGMVESFRKTFDGWLDQRLTAELYIRTSNSSVANKFKYDLHGKVDAILPIVNVPQNILGEVTDIYGFQPHKTYEDHWPLIYQTENAWIKVKQKAGIMINEQLSRRLDLNISEMIAIESKIGEPIRFEIVGVYSDYGNPKGQLMLPLELFNKYFPDEPELSFAIRVPQNLIPEIKNILYGQFSKEDIVITDQLEIKNLSKQIFQKTFNITASLSILTLGIAGMALFASITTLGDNRRAQLAPLWSIGNKRKTLALLEALRSVSLSTLTFIFSVPVGLVIVFILTNFVNLEAFGWKLPIFYFPMQWLSMLFVTITITLLATFLHSFKLAIASPAELLKASQYDT